MRALLVVVSLALAAAAIAAATPGRTYRVSIRGTVAYGPSTGSHDHQQYAGGGPGCFATLTTTSHDVVEFASVQPIVAGAEPAFGAMRFSYTQMGSGTYGSPNGSMNDGSACPQGDPLPTSQCTTQTGTMRLRVQIVGRALVVSSSKHGEPGSFCPGGHPAALQVYRATAAIPVVHARHFAVHGESRPYPNVTVTFTATLSVS